MERDRLILNYGLPPQPSRPRRLAMGCAGRVAVAAVLFVAAVVVPFPEGIWYFGHRPQWIVAVDWAGLDVGPSGHTLSLGVVPVIAAKLLAVSLPVWLVWHYWTLFLQGRSAEKSLAAKHRD